MSFNLTSNGSGLVNREDQQHLGFGADSSKDRLEEEISKNHHDGSENSNHSTRQDNYSDEISDKSSSILKFLFGNYSPRDTIRNIAIMTLTVLLCSIACLFILMLLTKEDKSKYAFAFLRNVLPSFLFHESDGMRHESELKRVEEASLYLKDLPQELITVLEKSFSKTREADRSNSKTTSRFCIGIPTVKRGVDYLHVLLQSILANTSMSDLIPTSNIAVNVFDATGNENFSPHVESISHLRNVFNFFRKSDITEDKYFFHNSFSNIAASQLPYHQKQALDYITTLEYCQKYFPHMEYTIILEDDAVVPKGWIDSIREMINTLNRDYYMSKDEEKIRLFKDKRFMWIKLFFAHAYNDFNEKRIHVLSNVAIVTSLVVTLGYIWIQYKRIKKRGDTTIVLNRCTIYWFAILTFVISLLFLLLMRFHYLEAKFIKLTRFFSGDGDGAVGRKYHLQRDFPHYGSVVAMVYPNDASVIQPFINYLREWQPKANREFPNDRIIYNYVAWFNHKILDNFLSIPDLVEHIGSVSSRDYYF
ncbi:hypothetical protein C9374_012779 [Naegleria lovaniensis]|uniref:Uncharacterized protein n=1 Tax=Naegleria lovaniensis TaxID=51637 RepID=A0AA88KHT3_NAELO|nr:uncharacterized protein C9374_012779 [Naegleria lovaniensis]KAG2373177.1 hypothetical protein C9374_012779 [Naegleria lovaniensis]